LGIGLHAAGRRIQHRRAGPYIRIPGQDSWLRRGAQHHELHCASRWRADSLLKLIALGSGALAHPRPRTLLFCVNGSSSFFPGCCPLSALLPSSLLLFPSQALLPAYHQSKAKQSKPNRHGGIGVPVAHHECLHSSSMYRYSEAHTVVHVTYNIKMYRLKMHGCQ